MQLLPRRLLSAFYLYQHWAKEGSPKELSKISSGETYWHETRSACAVAGCWRLDVTDHLYQSLGVHNWLSRLPASLGCKRLQECRLDVTIRAYILSLFILMTRCARQRAIRRSIKIRKKVSRKSELFVYI